MTCMRQLLAANETLGRENQVDRVASIEAQAEELVTTIADQNSTNSGKQIDLMLASVCGGHYYFIY